jgi:two-component system, sporulation sensor kinase B
MIMTNSYDDDEKLYKLLKHLVHDLRSPLSGLFMWLKGTDSRLPPDEKAALKRIATRMQDSLNGASFAADKRDVSLCSLNIHNLIQDMIQEKKIEYMDYDVKFIYNVPDNYHDININGGKDDFCRMLSNLLNNAIEACCDKTGQIVISLGLEQNYIYLEISDNGCGMPDKVLQKLRNNISVTHGKAAGHGLGFKQILETIKSLKGRLTINSKVGVGTKMSIEFELDK